MADIFTAVDLTSIAVFIIASGVLIVGGRMAMKGIGLAKEAIKKA